MNSPLQEMKMWPQEVNPLRFRRAVGGGGETLRCNPVCLAECLRILCLGYCTGHFLKVSEHALIGCHGEIRLNANGVAVSNPI